MDSGIQPKKPSIDRFWDRYFEVLKLFRVPDRSLPWYQKHIQSFIDDHPTTRLQEHTPETLQCFLQKLGQNKQITDWIFSQKLDALRLLYCHFLQLSWAKSFDWDIWNTDARSLGNDHPAVAHSYVMINKSVEEAKNYLGKRFPDIYRKFLVAIRMPDYSTNTEKSYLSWIIRFLRFHPERHPYNYSEPEVASFLEHLAIKRKVAGATQAQALNALVFFFTRVLEQPLGEIGSFKRPKKTETNTDCIEHKRDTIYFHPPTRHEWSHDPTYVRDRHASHGVHKAADYGPGF